MNLQSYLAVAVMALAGMVHAQPNAAAQAQPHNIYEVALAWKNTAAEYDALYYQGFNIARAHVDNFLAKHPRHRQKLAVISDLDDTLLSPQAFWIEMMKQNSEFFDDPLWDKLIAEYTLKPTAGAVEFARYLQSKGVEIFYVSSRNQGDKAKTHEYAIEQLKKLGFPYADAEHVKILMDSSNKEAIQNDIARDYHVIVKLGDNLNDFNRSFYTQSIDERKQQAAAQKAKFGTEYVLFPNPTDGHWVRAIFGDSEPPQSDENVKKWRDAAEGKLK